MEQLLKDVLLVIVKKVVASGTQNLLRFKSTSVYHKKNSPTKNRCLGLYQETAFGTFLTIGPA